QYRCTATLHYASPGTGRAMEADFSFGLYLLFQCHLKFDPRPVVGDGEDAAINSTINLGSVAYHANLLRGLFAVLPADGIGAGSQYHITGP
ncbi:hypothetical protein IWQ60_012544, partial [Tieghemiomyces parasiticus]